MNVDSKTMDFETATEGIAEAHAIASRANALVMTHFLYDPDKYLGDNKELIEEVRRLNSSHFAALEEGVRVGDPRSMEALNWLGSKWFTELRHVQEPALNVLRNAMEKISHVCWSNPTTMNMTQLHYTFENVLNNDAKNVTARELLREQWPLLKEHLSTVSLSHVTTRHALFKLVGTTVGWGKKQERSKAKEWLKKRFPEPNNFTMRPMDWGAMASATAFSERGRETIGELVGSEYGLKGTGLASSWIKNTSEFLFPNYLGSNVEAMMYLELLNSGACKGLHDGFGMKNFGRYQQQASLEQHARRNEADALYGLSVTAGIDHNGALNNKVGRLWRYLTGGLQALNDLHGGSRHLRCIEVRSKEEWRARLGAMRQQYARRKAIFLLLSAHSGPYAMDMGPNGERLFASDIADGFFDEFRDLFTDNLDVVIEGCSAGREGGIAQVLSRKMVCRVQAATTNTQLTHLTVGTSRNGDASLHPKFKNDPGVMYLNGERIG